MAVNDQLHAEKGEQLVVSLMNKLWSLDREDGLLITSKQGLDVNHHHQTLVGLERGEIGGIAALNYTSLFFCDNDSIWTGTKKTV